MAVFRECADRHQFAGDLRSWALQHVDGWEGDRALRWLQTSEGGFDSACACGERVEGWDGGRDRAMLVVERRNSCRSEAVGGCMSTQGYQRSSKIGRAKSTSSSFALTSAPLARSWSIRRSWPHRAAQCRTTLPLCARRAKRRWRENRRVRRRWVKESTCKKRWRESSAEAGVGYVRC